LAKIKSPFDNFNLKKEYLHVNILSPIYFTPPHIQDSSKKLIFVSTAVFNQ